MPRFFFHVVDGTVRRLDQDGQSCKDESAAREVALTLARELGGQADYANSHVEIYDANGKEIGRVAIP
jgi:hypothetical protein